MKSILKISLLSTLIGTSSVVMANDVIPLQKGDIALSELKHSTSEFQKDSGSLAKVQNATAIIDVVIFYQPSFMEFWGDQVGYARIHEWVEEANQTLANSDIDAAYRVKKISPTISIPDIPYDDVLDEDGNVIEDGAGYLFSVNVLNDFPSNPERDIYVKFDGDLVVYVRSYEGETTGGSSVRGYGSIQGQSSTVFDWQVHDSNAIDAGGHTLAHEFGHNLGAGHERENNNFFTGETYAAAYRCGGINTAVWSGFNGTAHKFYSSPNKIVDGEKCGVEIGEVDEADNASAIRSFAPIAAVRAQATPSLGTVSIDEQVILVDEVTGKVEVSLTRSGDITESASVEVAAFNETAIQGEDFVEGYIEAVFQAGQATTSVEFTISQDSEIENNERFTLALRYPYKLTASTKESVVVITSNGSDVTGDFSFGDVRASEQAKEACVTINRENGTNGEVIFLANTENGTASNDDYIALDSKKYAKIQVEKIKQRTEILKLQPKIGKLVEEINNPKVREILLGNYRIIYRNVSSKVIDILMIHHGARDLYRRIKN